MSGLREALRQPDIAKRLEELTYEVIGSSPEELASFNEQETRQWRTVIRAANIKLD